MPAQFGHDRPAHRQARETRAPQIAQVIAVLVLGKLFVANLQFMPSRHREPAGMVGRHVRHVDLMLCPQRRRHRRPWPTPPAFFGPHVCVATTRKSCSANKSYTNAKVKRTWSG